MAEKKIDVCGILANLPLFRQLDADEIKHLAQGTFKHRVSKNKILFQKGDPPHGFYVVAYGQIKLAFPSANGAGKVVEIIGSGQRFGEAVMFLEKSCPVSAQALADTLCPHRQAGDLLHFSPA